MSFYEMKTSNQRDAIFVSHANPEDNDLAVWLTLQLTNLGYKVWCDQVKFKGGEDFWGQAEEIIRNRTFRFLFVVTRNSQSKIGTLKELALADKTRTSLGISDFIIPLHVDSFLSQSDFKSEIVRQISIPFINNWAEGLKQLAAKLEKENVPKYSHIDFNYVNQWWENERFSQQKIFDTSEKYTSNWLPVISFPERLYFHNFKIAEYWRIRHLRYPCTLYKNYLVTFGEYDEFVNENIYPKNYNPKESISINLKPFIAEHKASDFISFEDVSRFLIQIVSRSWEKFMIEKGFTSYQLSGRKKALFPKKNLLENDKIHFKKKSGKSTWRAYVGTKTVSIGKEYHWHYAISAYFQISPLSFVINSHIIFTYDGVRIIDDLHKQHVLRRRVGKDWWNNDWRDRLVNLVKYLSTNKDELTFKVSNKNELICSSNFIELESPVSYKDPEKKEILIDIDDREDGEIDENKE